MPQYYHKEPPYCRSTECSEIYQHTTWVPSLSYINTGSENISGNGVHFSPDSIRVGMEKTNANMRTIKNAVQNFADVYAKYRQNIGLTYSFEAVHPDILNDPSRHLTCGDVMYFMPSAVGLEDGCWNYACATSGYENEALGVVSFVSYPTSCFGLIMNGYLSSGGLPMSIPGVTYFLSDVTPGKVMTVNPTTPGNISKPIYTAISNYEIIVDIKRGAQVANFSVWP